MRKMELSWRRNYNAENIADWRKELSMTQKKSPADTGPITRNTDTVIIAGFIENLKAELKDLRGGRYE